MEEQTETNQKKFQNNKIIPVPKLTYETNQNEKCNCAHAMPSAGSPYLVRDCFPVDSSLSKKKSDPV